MKLYSWNINGIRAAINRGSLQSFIDSEKPDILCLQETKAEQDQVAIDLPNYQEFWNAADKKGYAGTAIFTKIPPLSVRYNFPDEIVEKYQLVDNYGDPNREGRVIAIELNDYWTVTVYTPNSKGDLSRLSLRHDKWDPAFLEYVRELNRAKPVFFCGDLNVAHAEIDLANPKQNKGKHGFTAEERAGFDNYEKAGFIDTFRHFYPDKTDAYTWWSPFAHARDRNIGWRIDYWLASDEALKHVKSAKIHPGILGSDHCPISIEVD